MFENLELALAGDKSFWKTLFARLTPAQRDHIDEVLDIDRRSPEQRASLARTLSHGQKQWLEIGMLLMQEPGPAAGRRAGGRHDAAGNRAHRGTARSRSPASTP